MRTEGRAVNEDVRTGKPVSTYADLTEFTLRKETAHLGRVAQE